MDNFQVTTTFPTAGAPTGGQFLLAPGWGIVFTVVALFAVALFGWQGLLSLPQAWLRDEYSHGYLIPVIALYLFARRIDKGMPWRVAGPRWPGTVLAVVSLALILLGNLAQIPDIGTYGLIGFVFALLLVNFGLRSGFLFWVPVAYLVFMLPLPNFVYLRLSIALQLLSSEIGVWFLGLFGVPVFLEGNVIDLGVYKLQVAEACSGLRYLFPLASFGFLFAALYNGPIWHKIIIFVSAIPVTVLMNSFRIGVIGYLVDRFGIGQAEGFLHAFEGWIVFAACIAVIFAEVLLLQLVSGSKLRIADTLDLEMIPIRAQLRGLVATPSSYSLAGIAALASVLAALWVAIPSQPFERVPRDTFSQFPLQLANWSGATQDLELSVETVLGADDYFLAEYSAANTSPNVGLFMAFYHRMAGGKGIHSPEVCLPVGGWEVSDWTKKQVTLNPGDANANIEVNRAIIQRGLSKQLVYYWFELHGRRTTSSYASKFYTIVDSLTIGRTDAGIVRLVTPIAEFETELDAENRLREFLMVVRPTLSDYIPD